ncbi:hypothetical protein [Cohnella nanjingensis]|nr:hypothetical protein [Cohnella nanjingensis]
MLYQVASFDISFDQGDDRMLAKIRVKNVWLIAIGVAFIMQSFIAFVPRTSPLSSTAHAAIGTSTPGTMADYWNGNADWVFLRKDTQASTGFKSYFDGAQVKMMSDGTWYLFNRKYVPDSTCLGGTALEMQVRKSTNKGVTWSLTVLVLPHVAGTPYACDATDGDVIYNATENQWHFLFQCSDDSSWKGCMLSRSGADPMGLFTIAPAKGNPVLTGGQLWNQICNTATKKCSVIAGGPGKVHDEGTFNIFKYDGTYYWVGFHGYDGVHGYRGIAKTADFQNWIAGDSAQGVPADAVMTLNDSATWRESWATGGSVGGGAGSMIQEGSYYYHLVEAADVNLACTSNQNWDYGLFRSSSLTNTTWDQFPRGNPVIYSSRASEDANGILPCNVQYAGMYKDPTDGFIYLAYGRRSNDANDDGLYWYRLEKSANLLKNSDFGMSTMDYWYRLGPGTNRSVYRLPNNSPDGTPYLASNCGGTCVGTNSIYQDVSIAGGTSGILRFGGKFMSEGANGSLSLVIRQFDSTGTIIQTDNLPIGTTTSWASFGQTVALQAAARTIRYEYYMWTNNLTYRADDTYLQTSTIDTIAPSAVTDLKVSSVASSSAVLSWTAPGNDGGAGTAGGRQYKIFELR